MKCSHINPLNSSDLLLEPNPAWWYWVASCSHHDEHDFLEVWQCTWAHKFLLPEPLTFYFCLSWASDDNHDKLYHIVNWFVMKTHFHRGLEYNLQTQALIKHLEMCTCVCFPLSLSETKTKPVNSSKPHWKCRTIILSYRSHRISITLYVHILVCIFYLYSPLYISTYYSLDFNFYFLVLIYFTGMNTLPTYISVHHIHVHEGQKRVSNTLKV